MYRAAASFNLWAVKLGAKMVEARSKLKKMPSNTSLSQVRHRLENDMLLQVEANDHVPEDVSLDSEASSISDLEDEGTETIDNMIIVTGAPPPFRSSIVRERVSMRGVRPEFDSFLTVC